MLDKAAQHSANELEYSERFNQPHIRANMVVIWLHGLGADNTDFLPIVNQIPLKSSIKFIFPNAPLRPITINNGYVMRGWYDIQELGSNLAHLTDVQGILQSVIQIEAIIKQQIELGFTALKIVVAGFSQGGVISYITGLRSKYQLAGILALSCYLPAMPLLLEGGVNKTTPFFAIHGTEDTVVPYTAGLHAYEKLKSQGYNIQWAEYPMPHSVCLQEIQAIGAWLDKINE